DGYEVDRSMVYYGKPSRLAPDTEERVASEVMKQIPQTFYSEETLQLLPAPIKKDDAVSTISVADDLVVELVAAEPLVQDPVDIAWDYEGRLWVVEMADYPIGVDGKPGGRVRYLVDEDDDGFYDKSTVFLDGLAYPNSVMPWRNGVLVTTANGIFMAHDSDGDLVADSKEPIIEGLPAANPQHQLGGLQWGLDGWVHSANELRGDGREIKSVKTGETLNLSSGDLRFHPDTGEFALRSGRTQFGLSRDDWGNWFGSSNSRPWWHCPLDERYLRRNPNVIYPSPYAYLGDPPSAGPVYPTSKALKRFNDYDKVNRITSACNVAPYRDTLIGNEASRSLFVAEPVHNLVTRIVLEPNGATFTGRRAKNEQESEFFASTDSWCRPTAIRTGPDGAIYIVDMYRLVIEHPEWIPEMWQRRLNLRAGHDKGRIYRVRPKDRQLREFAPSLESQNGTQRDLAHQQLVWNAGDGIDESFEKGKLPQTRLQAMAALDQLESMNENLLTKALKDEHPGVRKQAVRIAEGRSNLLPLILDLARDEDAFVRQQVACSLGEFEDESAGLALAQMLVANRDDAYITAAILSSAKRHISVIANNLGSEFLKLSKDVVSGLERTGQFETRNALTEAILGEGALRDKLWLAAYADQSKIGELIDDARTLAADDDAKHEDRALAISLLGSEDAKLLFELTNPKQPQAVQSAALSRISDPQQLLEKLPDLNAQSRNEAIGLFVVRPKWTPLLLDQPDLVRRLDPTQRASLANHRDAKIRERAQLLFKPDATAEESMKRLESSLTMSGDRENGRQLFVGLCSTCHKLDDVGFHVGPDLAALTNKSRAALLLAIVDPNQAMEDKYAMVSAETKDGSALAGVVTAESEASITVLGPGGQSQTFLRAELKSVANAGISMMPRGLEAGLNPQQMADLLVYLQIAGAGDGIVPGEGFS
ncbi:MAG: PVC-type heme-binding CxxCH protein, partial [Verrucomicrobiota bacterium]